MWIMLGIIRDNLVNCVENRGKTAIYIMPHAQDMHMVYQTYPHIHREYRTLAD